ncbi:hypothetical protein QJS10_CPA03g00380 [Acorus calamus]|uniref:PWWP domain-containing protein n=1 Tax=Acorus calamus TaxID=4465 RepID=A0AAV9F3R9_ACOCL|nr:hypothetical protein QJS10_CPA03g00380 [Acorus calamus]
MADETPNGVSAVEAAMKNGKLTETLETRTGRIEVCLVVEGVNGINGSDSTPPEENGKGDGLLGAFGTIEVALIDESARGVDINGSGSIKDEHSEGRVFVPGDLVWGRKKRHTWWPGKVHDPSDASEQAERVTHDGGLLVAFFDGTFAWFDPSQQLKPFVEGFAQMSRQSGSTRFTKALDAALEELARSAESEMSCACIPELPKRTVRNAGIREGSVAPCCRIDGLFDSEVFVEKLRVIACDVSVCDRVEASVLRGRLSALYCYSGCGRLTGCGWYRDIMDQPFNEVEVEEEDLHERKNRSMAELIAEMDVELGNHSNGDFSDGPTFNQKKNKKEREKEKRMDTEEPEMGAEGGEEEEGEIWLSGSRKRKRSKYLSYPYTNVGHYKKKSWIPGDDSEGKEKKLRKRLRVSSPSSVPPRMEGQNMGVPPIAKCSGESFHNKRRKGQVGGDDGFEGFEEDRKSVDKMLVKMRTAALNVWYLKQDSALDSVMGFFEKFRSLAYSGDSDSKASKKDVSGLSGEKKKKKSRPVPPTEVVPIENEVKQKKMRRAEKGEGETDGDSPAALLMTFAPSVTLPSKEDLIEMFSKLGELNESETEVLKDSGCARVVFRKSSCAEVAYNGADKIGSFEPGAVRYRLRYLSSNNSHLEMAGGGSCNGGESKVEEEKALNAVVKKKPQLESIREKLQMMMTILEDPHHRKVGTNEGELSPGAKEKLVKEMKGLLKKVHKLPGPSTPTITDASA